MTSAASPEVGTQSECAPGPTEMATGRSEVDVDGGNNTYSSNNSSHSKKETRSDGDDRASNIRNDVVDSNENSSDDRKKLSGNEKINGIDKSRSKGIGSKIGTNEATTSKSKSNNGEMTPTSSSSYSPNKAALQPEKQQQQKRSIQTITIAAEDVIASSSIVSIVDPWVPRICNNDEYLQRGLDLSPMVVSVNENATDDEGVANNAIDGDHITSGSGSGSSGGGRQPKFQQKSISPLVGDIGATRLSDALVRNTRLLFLNLSRNDIGIEGGVALARSLYSFSLNPHCSRTTGGGDSGGDGNISNYVFQSKTALRVLNLSHNRISNEGAMAFAQALRRNTSLKELKLSDNMIQLEGVLALLEGLKINNNLKRLSLVDNVKNLKGGEMTSLVQSVGKVLRTQGSNNSGKSALEVLEMHSSSSSSSSSHPAENDKTDNNGKTTTTGRDDNFDVISKDDVRCLKDAIMFLSSNAESHKLKNHRFRTLTLPECRGRDDNHDGKGEEGHGHDNNIHNNRKVVVSHQLRKILQFNTFYRPILQLHDILNSPLAQAEAALSVPIKLPYHLQRDLYSGALIALLPSSFSSANSSAADKQSASPPSPSSSSRAGGAEYKIMPQVLSFACNECTLDSVWNVIRYRPDLFCCADEAGMTALADCGGGCCIS